MATRPTVPYYASPDCLPAPLPSVAEILASKYFLPNLGGVNVVRVNEHFVVKYGERVNLQEGENMLFVRQSTNVPVPTVYALFQDEATGYKFIVQEYIRGMTLKEAWGGFSQDEKEAAVVQLRQNFDELRSLPSPGYFGGVWRQPLIDFWMMGAHDRKHVADLGTRGPFETEKQWVEAMLLNAQTIYPHAAPRYNYAAYTFRKFFCGHKPVFTHGDLVRSNILIREDKTLVIIDWQYSGWHPSYWEYCLISATCGYDDDWPLWIPRFLDEYISEMGWMSNFFSWILYRGW